MKIVYTIESLHQSGGTERVLTTKMNWLAEEGHDVTIILAHQIDKPFFTLSPKVKIVDFKSKSRKEYRNKLTETLYAQTPDITISVGGMELPFLYKIKDGSKKILEFHYKKNYLVDFVKGIHKIRFRQLHILKMRWLQWKAERYSRHYDKVVALTAKDISLWGKPRNMTYIYNPLSFRTDRKATGVNKIIAVGSWAPYKGMDLLVTAFGMIAHKYPDWTLSLYGSGQDEQLLRDIIDNYDMASQVSLNPPVPNIQDKFIEASIYAHPSRSEGFGLVITEAMECGLPTVSMDCDCGPREILSGKSGILVPNGNVSAFANALEKLINDEKLRTKMGENAVKEVMRFYPEAIMPQWLNLFNQLLKS